MRMKTHSTLSCWSSSYSRPWGSSIQLPVVLSLRKEGMTSTTLKFEERLVHLQNNRPRSMKVRISYFSNYLRYLIARTFFRSLLELLGPLILDYYGNSAKEEAHDVHIIFGIVGLFSLYLLLHSQVFFSELKVIVILTRQQAT